MSILDNIKDTNVKREDYGRLFSSQPIVEYVSPEKYLMICWECKYRTWFSISPENIDESECEDLSNVLITVCSVVDVSSIYIVESIFNNFRPSVYVGINCDVRTIKDAVKFLWTISSAFWRSFVDVRLTISVGWLSEYVQKGNHFMMTNIRFDKFLDEMYHFHADMDHNCIDDFGKDKSVIYHLIGRPVTQMEVYHMYKWCRTYEQNIVRTSDQPSNQSGRSLVRTVRFAGL